MKALLRAEFWGLVLLFTNFRYGATQFDRAQMERRAGQEGAGVKAG